MKYINKEDLIKMIYMSPVWTGLDAITRINTMPTIDLADYVPKDFHDKTCEAMAKRHQEEIEDMVSVVRCKECEKWLRSSGICMWDKSTSLFTKADDFCSYGERSE